MLHCEQCGCSGELSMGWVTFVRADADEGDDTPWTGAYCPPCAAAQFGYPPDVAQDYVCVWGPIEAETAEGPKLQEEAGPPRQPRRRRRRRRTTKR